MTAHWIIARTIKQWTAQLVAPMEVSLCFWNTWNEVWRAPK